MGITDRKRQREGTDRRPKKVVRKFKKQKNYHSSSEDEDEDENEEVNDAPTSLKTQPQVTETSGSEVTTKVLDGDDEVSAEADVLNEDDDAEIASSVGSSESGDDDNSHASDSGSDDGVSRRKTKKRNDASALSTSISKILGAKLSSSRRADPVLARSQAAAEASKELIESRLETKARKKINAEKRNALKKGRVEDVLGLERPDISTADIQEQEKRLRKTAQRGVVKLFNAVRAAQVQGEVARSEARKQGVVGMSQREERVGEMSKQGFLDLIAKDGKKAQAASA